MFKSYNRCYDTGRAPAVGWLAHILGSTTFAIFTLLFWGRSSGNLEFVVGTSGQGDSETS
jgi:hypothetical protein